MADLKLKMFLQYWAFFFPSNFSESKEHSFVILPFKVQVVEKPMNIIKVLRMIDHI